MKKYNKYQEAFTRLASVITKYSIDIDEIDMEKSIKSLETLRVLVEKETPKKPVRFIDKFYVSPFKCPICKTIPHTGLQKYCDECGQKLDWSKEDE